MRVLTDAPTSAKAEIKAAIEARIDSLIREAYQGDITKPKPNGRAKRKAPKRKLTAAHKAKLAAGRRRYWKSVKATTKKGATRGK